MGADGIVSADGARQLRDRYAVEPRAGLAQVIVGAVGALLVGTGLIAVLASNWDDFPRWCWLLLAVVAGFAVVAFRQGRHAVLAVAGLAAVPLFASPLSSDDTSGWPVAIAYSLVLLATAIALITLEFLGRQGAARIGAALITLLVVLRMADAELSLLTKGIAFVVIGCGFLGFNALISRRRSAVAGGSPA